MNLSIRIPNYYLLNQLTFRAFYISATYAILLWSPNSLGRYFPDTLVTIIFILPLVMLWLMKGMDIVKNKEHRIEIALIIIIIILGIINILLSDNPSKTYTAMRVFLLGGIVALWVSMFLLKDPCCAKNFDWFCCFCLAIIVPTEILDYLFFKNNFSIFANNPIPLGTLLILLSTGPVRLLSSAKKWPVIFASVLMGLGVSLILLTGKRGISLAIIVIGLTWFLLKRTRLNLALVTFLIFISLIIPLRNLSSYANLDQEIPSHYSILHRLELYPFALHVYLKHPVFGIGLRPLMHENYLKDYQNHQKLNLFAKNVKELQTFDNMLLTAFAELGTLMTLAYLGLIGLIIFKYCRKLRPLAKSPPVDIYRLLVLIGFAVHSLTYDSLLFPSVNWLFHVQLGILVGYSTPTGPIHKEPENT